MPFDTIILLRASPKFSQNLATVRTTHAMSGRVIVTVHMSAPTAYQYENLNISSSSSGVCGSSTFERLAPPKTLASCLPSLRQTSPPSISRINVGRASVRALCGPLLWGTPCSTWRPPCLSTSTIFHFGGKPLHRHLIFGVGKDIVHVHDHHHLRLSIIDLATH